MARRCRGGEEFLGELGAIAAAAVEENGCVGVGALGEVDMWFWEVCIHDVDFQMKVGVKLLLTGVG